MATCTRRSSRFFEERQRIGQDLWQGDDWVAWVALVA